jgi:hypothetical protein
MKVGFSGSRLGMTAPQLAQIAHLLEEHGATELHHGDCVGADAEVHALAVARGIRVVLHPPKDPKLRAFCLAAESRPPKGYLVRNADIVRETDLLLAAPSGPEQPRSGTWATIRRAIELGRPVCVVLPSGARIVTVVRGS